MVTDTHLATLAVPVIDQDGQLVMMRISTQERVTVGNTINLQELTQILSQTAWIQTTNYT